MYFPIETIFRANDGSGVIRLKVAAICICLDIEIDGSHYFDEEIEPFFRSVETVSVTGDKHDSQIDPHAFLYLQPTGNLAGDVENVLNALNVSIDKGQLRTVFLRVDLDGVIDVAETWILTKDFYSWCASRGLEPGDMCNNYDEGEFAVFDHAAENGCDLRKQLEAPYFNVEYTKHIEYIAESSTTSKAQYEKILLENMIMRQGFLPQENAVDRPLRTTERNVLLAIIAVLCSEAKYDYARPAKTAGLIKKKADEMGLNIGESTIENHLKKIPDTLETRMK